MTNTRKNSAQEATLSDVFAEFVSGRPEFTEKAMYLAKRSIADSMGAIVIGSKNHVTQNAMRLAAKAAGGATIAGLGGGYLSRDAAFVNGIAGHELELDDTSSSNLGHPTIAVLAALLALGEERGCSGKQLLEAFLVGTEVECKVGRICARKLHERGWHASSITGAVGAVAGCSYLLGQSFEKARDAIGIAASMASGVRENFGTSTKSIHIGKANEDGVRAALLAEAGFDSSREALDGKEGYLFEYSTKTLDELLDSSLAEFARTLGHDWDVCSPGFAIKRYPSCSSTHRAVDGLVSLIDENGIAAPDIKAITVGLSKPAMRELVSPYPNNGEEAKFSIGFQIALYLLGIANMPENYREDVIFQPEVQRIVQATKMYNEEKYDGLPVDMGVGPALVSIELSDGRRFSKEQVYPVGHLTNPMPEDELRAKFDRCTVDILGREKSELLYNKLMALEQTETVAELMQLTV